MNLTEEKKAPLRARDMGFKRNMLSMHIKGAAKVSSHWQYHSTVLYHRLCIDMCVCAQALSLIHISEPTRLA